MASTRVSSCSWEPPTPTLGAGFGRAVLLPNVAIGLRRSGRSWTDIELTGGGFTVFGETESDIEQKLGTQYTADTLRKLVTRFPSCRFVWLMGADNLTQIPRWQNWTRIFASTPVAVFSRPPYSLSALHGKAAQRYRCRRVGQNRARGLPAMEPPAWVLFQNPLHPASATEIRKRRAQAAAAASGGQPVQQR